MKLYTEEQVITFAIKVLSDYEINGTFYNREKLKETLDITPIELPSDEEIEDKGKWVFNNAGHTIFTHYNTVPSWVEGAKWVKEQILNQNK
jgi:hypothetical protein